LAGEEGLTLVVVERSPWICASGSRPSKAGGLCSRMLKPNWKMRHESSGCSSICEEIIQCKPFPMRKSLAWRRWLAGYGSGFSTCLP